MRIRTNIFIWVFFATVVPLTGLTLAATYYSQFDRQEKIRHELGVNLDNITTSIARELQNQKNMLLGISRAPAVQAFKPVLLGIIDDELPPNNRILRQRITRYLEGFQTIISDAFILRVLDVEGNSLIRVDLNRTVKPSYENLSGIQYAEQEILNEQFTQLIQSLPADEASPLRLPHSQQQVSSGFSFLLQDLIVPLHHEGKFIGAISFTIYGANIVRLLNTASRLYGGKLIVIEQDSEHPEEVGYLFYSQENQPSLAPLVKKPFVSRYSKALLELASDKNDGHVITDNNNQIYYRVMMPYPNQFIAWIIASEIDANTLSEPFSRIRLGILSIATIALFFSILIMMLGSKRIAKPLCELANNIKEFAEGNQEQRLSTEQPIDEIRALANEFNYLADTLQATEKERDRAQQLMLQNDKLVSIGEMAAGIGHEINNPLNNILSYSKLINRTLSNDNINSDSLAQTRADLSALRDEAIRASDIVAGILNFARQVPLRYGKFNICEWLDKTIQLVQQAARTKLVVLETHCDFSGEIDGDQNQLQQALVNLILNAIYVSQANQTIKIQCRQVDSIFEITVEDQGSGINPEHLNKIFDPFFTTKPEGIGTGLGLSISHGIIERHNGKLDLRNLDTGGVCARIQLPLHYEV